MGMPRLEWSETGLKAPPKLFDLGNRNARVMQAFYCLRALLPSEKYSDLNDSDQQPDGNMDSVIRSATDVFQAALARKHLVESLDCRVYFADRRLRHNTPASPARAVSRIREFDTMNTQFATIQL